MLFTYPSMLQDTPFHVSQTAHVCSQPLLFVRLSPLVSVYKVTNASHSSGEISVQRGRAGQEGLREDCHVLFPTLVSRKLRRSLLMDQVSQQLVSRYKDDKFVSQAVLSGSEERRSLERLKYRKLESPEKSIEESGFSERSRKANMENPKRLIEDS